MEAHRRRVMDRALEIQSRQAREGEEKVRDAAMRAAAAEVGVDPALLEQAEAELKAEDEARAAAAEKAKQARERAAKERNAKLGRVARYLAVAGALTLGVGVAWRVLSPPPPEPWVEAFSEPGRWALDVNPGTVAGSAFEEEAGRGTVGVIRVESFAPGADGKFVTNLDSVGTLDLSAFSQASFDVRGEGLGTVRLYLEQGDVRWRSPAVPVTSAWTTHTLPFTSFERQQRTQGWKVTGWSHPETVDTLSFKVGHYMNGPEARGEVRIDDLTME